MRLNVGRIGRAHGILGEATIEVRTDDAASRFALGATLETDSNGTLVVDSVRVHNGILLLAFVGYSDRNAIEKLRDVLLYADVDINALTRLGHARLGVAGIHPVWRPVPWLVGLAAFSIQDLSPDGRNGRSQYWHLGRFPPTALCTSWLHRGQRVFRS